MIALWATLAVASSATAADVFVITDENHPVVAAPGVRVILLDAPTRLAAPLSAQLPTEPSRAATIVRQRLQEGGLELQRRLAHSYQGVADAWALGVTKIPAVIVDAKFVVYGETNVRRAVLSIERYRRERQ